MKRIPTVTFVTTLDHNPGDEFIRLGLEYVLSTELNEFNCLYVHKHDPRSIYKSWDDDSAGPVWHRLTAGMQLRAYEALRRPALEEDKVLSLADVLVFAGGPYIWRQNVQLFPSTCANAEWVGPVWGRAARIAERTPIFNLAAGCSVGTIEDVPRLVEDARCREFLRRTVGLCDAVTLRDRVALDVFRRIGLDAPVVPCSSLLARDRLGIAPAPPEYIAFNYMRGGVRWSRGSRAKRGQWRRVARAVLERLMRRQRIVCVAHSRGEAEAARADLGVGEVFSAGTPVELLGFYSRASAGICNRVHAAAAIASFERPALVIGADTRVSLIGEFGLPTLDADKADADEVVAAFEQMLSRSEEHACRLRQTRAAAVEAYHAVIRPALEGRLPGEMLT